MLLLEGSRTNRLLHNRNLAQAPTWSNTVSGATTRTANAGYAVDGGFTAARLQVTAGVPGGWGFSQSLAGLMANPHVLSFYARGFTGAIAGRYNYPAVITSYTIAGTTYARFEKTGIANTGSVYYPVDTTAPTYPVQDNLIDLPQAEDGAFPTSAIRTTTTAVTRAADVLSYAVGQYPASFLTRGFRVVYAPDASNTQIVASGLNHVIVGSPSQTSFVCLIIDAGVLKARHTRAAVTIAETPVTFSRGQRMTFEVRPTDGALVVSGATTGNGTFSGSGGAWSGGLSIGHLVSNNFCFGRLGPTIEAL